MTTVLILLAAFLPLAATYIGAVLLLRRLVQYWEGRDVMIRFRPEARHVHHTERLLRVHRLTSLGKRR